jgi:hypothetical protein
MPAPVKEVLKFGQKRIVVDEKGNRETFSKRKMVTAFGKVLTEYQRQTMHKSVRTRKDLTAIAWLGGTQKGEKKVYVNKQAAHRAIDRHYDK